MVLHPSPPKHVSYIHEYFSHVRVLITFLYNYGSTSLLLYQRTPLKVASFPLPEAVTNYYDSWNYDETASRCLQPGPRGLDRAPASPAHPRLQNIRFHQSGSET